MEFRALKQENYNQWAGLLAVCFDRNRQDMKALLGWLEQMGQIVAWGAWDGDKLVAQYTSLLRHLSFGEKTISGGMSINMAVHPDYRGRGLVKQVSAPVYEEVRASGASIGFGFSNAEGVQVDKHSKGYNYQVIGEMQSLLSYLPKGHCRAIQITDEFPLDIHFACVNSRRDGIRFQKTMNSFRTRYAQHPFRQYKYGIWYENNEISGVVVYREIKRYGIRGISLMDACGLNMEQLIRRWGCTMRNRGFHFIHTVATPEARLAQILHEYYPTINLPYVQTPYYLTLRNLHSKLENSIELFENWDLIGGDIL